jgi:heme A synthase
MLLVVGSFVTTDAGGSIPAKLALAHRFAAVVGGVAVAGLGTMLVGGAVLLFSLFVLTQCPKHDELKRLATAVLFALFGQVVLGVSTYMSGMSANEDTAPGPIAAAIIAGHVTVGGILLAFCTLLGIQVRRWVVPKLAPVTDMQAAS